MSDRTEMRVNRVDERELRADIPHNAETIRLTRREEIRVFRESHRENSRRKRVLFA